MKYLPVVCPWLPANAMALYPFMLFKEAAEKKNVVLVHHEKIHFYQQLELLILPFYVLYMLNYLINLFRYKNSHQAYLHISFEKEAYANDRNFTYLKGRKLYAWVNFL